MSVFNPRSLSGQPDQKRALLERLMQQYQNAAGRSQGLQQSGSAFGGGQAATPFHAVHPFGGVGLSVHAPMQLPPGLEARLGPGAIGVPSPGHTGVLPGLPSNPHATIPVPGPRNPIGPVGPPAITPGPVTASPSPTSAPSGPAAAVAAAGPSLGALPNAHQIVSRIANIYSPHIFGIGGRI